MSLITTYSKTGRSIPIVINSKEPFSSNNHNMYRIIIIKTGSGIIKLNNKSIVFMAPSILCLNEKDQMTLEEDNDINAEVIYFLPITIHKEFTIHNINTDIDNLSENHVRNFFLLCPFLQRSSGFNGMLNISHSSNKRLIKLIKDLKKETSNFKNPYWPCRSRSFFLEVLFLIQYLYTEYEDETNISLISASSEINKIILYIHTNYSKKITLKDLAKKYNINRTTLSNRFSSETGYTIKKYIIKIRIKLASMMLKETLLPICEIAYRVGFNDTTHFTRTFKKHLNILPSKYREKMFQ